MTIDAVVLCGGMGSRLKGVSARLPKPMVEVAGSPFLKILYDYIRQSIEGTIVLCTGYGADYIEQYFTEGGYNRVVFSREDRPLGTAGAIKNAEALIGGEDFFVLNGDSFCPVGLYRFYRFHRESGGLCSMVVATVDDCSDYGTVVTDDKGRLVGFREKEGRSVKGCVNAGIYLFKREVLERIPKGRSCSLEYELIPAIMDEGIYCYCTDAPLYDIGTPERLELARKELPALL